MCRMGIIKTKYYGNSISTLFRSQKSLDGWCISTISLDKQKQENEFSHWNWIGIMVFALHALEMCYMRILYRKISYSFQLFLSLLLDRL